MTMVVGYIVYRGISSQQMEMCRNFNEYQEAEPTSIELEKEELEEPTSIELEKEELEEPTSIELEKEELEEPTRVELEETAMLNVPAEKPVDNECRCRTLPDVIIFGAKKCGTSALQEFLAFHPNIAAAEGEIFYFSKHYDREVSWYINKMPPSLPNQLTLEKTPAYFVTPEAPERLAQLSKNVKLLLILRDPVLRSISDYCLCKHYGLEKHRSYEEMVLDSEGNVRTKPPTCTSIIRDSFYDKYYANWNKVWHGKIHIIDGDKLSVDPYSELIKVEKFLNLPSYFTKDMFYFSASKGFPCFKQEDGHSYCLGAKKGFKHPNVAQEVKDKLYDTFRPHMINFCQQAGVNFSLCHI